ncbi:GAF domain-containing sensor histidine kinase, partial [bacterium]|nr:GAF domain-containing sensor histidine kinase [bacterium]
YKDKINYQDVLQKAGTILAREIDLEKLLQKLADVLIEKLKIKNICVLIPTNDHFQIVASTYKDKKEVAISTSFAEYVRNNHDLIIVEEVIRGRENLKEDSNEIKVLDKFIKEAEMLKAEVVVPVIEDKKLTAIFLISSKQSGGLYTDNDVDFFQVLVPQVANAIEKSKLYEEVEEFNKELQQKVEDRTRSLQEVNIILEERNKFLTTMQVVTNMISRTLDLKKVNQMIADAIASELGYIGGILSFIDKEKNVLKVGAITNNEDARKIMSILPREPREYESKLENDFNLGAQTALSGKINFSDKLSDFLSPPVEKEVVDKIQKALNVKACVGVPIFSEAKIIGVINFLLPIEKDKISSMDIEMMTALTNQVGIVSRNLKLYTTLQKANLELQDANLRLRELDKAKSEFLSIASHQLRTPISAIKGYLSMIIDGDFGKVPKNIKEVIANLFESSARLARLINIFLNVSRIESGRLKLEKKPIQINELIDGVIVELINQAKQKGLKLEYKKKKQAPPLIFADADKLREVVLNLIDNAIKYTPKGRVDILVEADKKTLTFKVVDTGIGIKKEEVKSLFRKFVRGSGVSQIHTGGSGLGLFIAQKIVKEHNGRVWVESEGNGKGSTFQFEVPVYDGHQVPEYKKEAEENN